MANVYENPGSCLTYDPFKFLDFSVASAEIPLTPEFKEDAKAMYDEHQQVLDLRFLQGKDILIDDSLNESQRETLVKDLNSYGDKLVQIEVQGGSSPEGSIERNTILANQRADRAIDMLRGRVSGAVRRVRLAPKIYTWDDVVAALEKMGNSEITETVSNTVKNNKPNEVYGILKNLPFFEQYIVPVLQRQRMMTFKYLVQRVHVMDADEAKAEYFRNKQLYMRGEKHFSNGDFYNLFATITDSAEVDDITRLAYKHLTSQPAWRQLPIAPYVANRMAIINNRRGTPDPEKYQQYLDELDKYLAEKSKRAKEPNVDNVPYFLAFFQHCFDLDPKLKKYYFNEGNVGEKVRKKYPYRKKDIERYRLKFNIIKAYYDREKAQTKPATNNDSEQNTDKTTIE